MSIAILHTTTIECDGIPGQSCPASENAVYSLPQRPSMTYAQRHGWVVGVETLCPDCSYIQQFAVAV